MAALRIAPGCSLERCRRAGSCKRPLCLKEIKLWSSAAYSQSNQRFDRTEAAIAGNTAYSFKTKSLRSITLESDAALVISLLPHLSKEATKMLVLAIQFSRTKNARSHCRRQWRLVRVVAAYPWSRRRRHTCRATQAVGCKQPSRPLKTKDRIRFTSYCVNNPTNGALTHLVHEESDVEKPVIN